MTRHLGVSVFLSVSIVVFFAVVLYQPEGASEGASAPVAENTGPLPAAAQAEPGPALRPKAVTDVEPVATAVVRVDKAPSPPVARTLPVSHRPPDPQPATARSSEAKGVNAPARPRPPQTSPRAEKPRLRATTPSPGERLAFIEADAGETVDDVALRVYGSPDAARALWMANRDILPDRAAPLSARTVLRSP
ncbi:MAG: hypothetical protein P4L84_07395 [Isosphaeraceae bacterium]|nr:hypothetical protein [Isosphaeraceae bacterium]